MLEYAFLTFGSLFAIVDPFAAVTPFIAMTQGDTHQRRRALARRASVTCFAIMSLFAILGPTIFRLFGITVPAFQIAGGLVLLLSSLDMLRAQRSPLRETKEELAEGVEKEDIAITPLAVPLLAGPGAITTSIVLFGRADSWQHRAVFFALIGAVAVLTYVVLTVAANSAKRLSSTVINVITRLMGMLLAAIGVQFILSALRIS